MPLWKVALMSTKILIFFLKHSRHIFTCFIDFTKAFNNVQYDKLINILRDKNIDSHDLRII